MSDKSKVLYRSPKRDFTIEEAIGGRMDGLRIAKVKSGGETYVSHWRRSIMEILRLLAFKKRMGFSQEREMKFFKTKRDED